MSKLILKFAYFLATSSTYYHSKRFIYQFLEDSESKKKTYFDFFMIFLVLTTVGILIYEVNHKPEEWLNTFETTAIFIFIFEWLGRLWVTSHSHKQIIKDYEHSLFINQPFDLVQSLKTVIQEKLSFIFSPMSIVDLLAILPAYRPLRILRILMLFRLFKLLRYANSIKQFSDVFIEKRFEFFTLAIMFFMATAFGSTIIFIYEGAGINPNINSFFDAIYWSVITISTVGFGDISPVTTEGKVATLFLVVGGLSVIAFFTSIVTTALSERMATLKEEKVVGEANALKDFALICGYGQMGKILANEFIKVKQKFIVIDCDDEMLDNTAPNHILSIKGNATDPALLESIGINNSATSIIAITDNDATNLSIILTARALNKDIKIIARANDDKIKNKLLIAGANEVISANEIASIVATEYLGQPIAFEAIDDILLNSQGAIMDEIEILENSPYLGSKLEEINFSDFNLTFIGIMTVNEKYDFNFNPPKDTYILGEKDILIVIGYEVAIAKFRVNILKSKNKKVKK